ncbi:single-stranded DNA-binding protein [Candidatus Saccharibacteria bacterium]|nr:single-stranded DNA-binding protein [Candidatus Saccharibacteria bacterium]
MAGFCNIVLMGNVTRDPELRTTSGGLTVTDVNIAVNTYKKGAENNQITTFYRGSIFGARAEVIAKNFRRGDPILICGTNLEIRTYEKSDGTTGISPEFSITDFSFVGNKGGGGGGNYSGGSKASESSDNSAPSGDFAPAPDAVEFSGDMSETPF